MNVYISGKITGLPEEEARGLFKEAFNKLMDSGFRPVNPMDLVHEHDLSWQSYMREDLIALLKCDAIYMLKNWAGSRGAKIEHQLAVDLGLKIFYDPCELEL